MVQLQFSELFYIKIFRITFIFFLFSSYNWQLWMLRNFQLQHAQRNCDKSHGIRQSSQSDPGRFSFTSIPFWVCHSGRQNKRSLQQVNITLFIMYIYMCSCFKVARFENKGCLRARKPFFWYPYLSQTDVKIDIYNWTLTQNFSFLFDCKLYELLMI